jgi:hypothetical protein
VTAVVVGDAAVVWAMNLERTQIVGTTMSIAGIGVPNLLIMGSQSPARGRANPTKSSKNLMNWRPRLLREAGTAQGFSLSNLPKKVVPGAKGNFRNCRTFRQWCAIDATEL